MCVIMCCCTSGLLLYEMKLDSGSFVVMVLVVLYCLL